IGNQIEVQQAFVGTIENWTTDFDKVYLYTSDGEVVHEGLDHSLLIVGVMISSKDKVYTQNTQYLGLQSRITVQQSDMDDNIIGRPSYFVLKTYPKPTVRVVAFGKIERGDCIGKGKKLLFVVFFPL